MKQLITTIRVFLIFTILLGIIYPLLVMILGQTFFPYQANGSLIKYQNKIIGSALIAQEFNSSKYFHSRFSAINYNAINSGASDLAITNTKLYIQAQKYIKEVKNKNSLPNHTKLPADMALTSGSGLDPHISLENALLQLPRVAEIRNLSTKTVEKLINKNLDPNFFGLWGTPGVNVLKLNLALDKLKRQKISSH